MSYVQKLLSYEMKVTQKAHDSRHIYSRPRKESERCRTAFAHRAKTLSLEKPVPCRKTTHYLSQTSNEKCQEDDYTLE